MTDEQKMLAADHLPMAISWAREESRKCPSLAHEIHSTVQYALCEAACRYDPGRGTKFSTFASYRIRGAIRDLKRAEFGDHKLMTVPILEDIPVFEDHDTAIDRRTMADRLLSALSPRSRLVMELIYLKGQKPVDAARRLGISRSLLYKLHDDSLKILRGVSQLPSTL